MGRCEPGETTILLERRRDGLLVADDVRAALEAEMSTDSRSVVEPGEDRLGEVASLIDGYETPLGMALLSSVHWIATHDAEAANSADETVRALVPGMEQGRWLCSFAQAAPRARPTTSDHGTR